MTILLIFGILLGVVCITLGIFNFNRERPGETETGRHSRENSAFSILLFGICVFSATISICFLGDF